MKHLLSLQSNQTWKLTLENLKHIRVSQECLEFRSASILGKLRGLLGKRRPSISRPLPLSGNVLFYYQECTALL